MTSLKRVAVLRPITPTLRITSGLYPIFDNCVREQTLLLIGRGLCTRGPGFKSRQGHGIFFNIIWYDLFSVTAFTCDHLFGKLLFTWLSLVVSMVMSFCAVLFPTRCLG